jgi:hypothetical protein
MKQANFRFCVEEIGDGKTVHRAWVVAAGTEEDERYYPLCRNTPHGSDWEVEDVEEPVECKTCLHLMENPRLPIPHNVLMAELKYRVGHIRRWSLGEGLCSGCDADMNAPGWECKPDCPWPVLDKLLGLYE